MAILGAGNAIKSFAGALPFGIGYAAGTKIGYEGLGEMLFPSQRRNTYNSRYPTQFKLPYYRYRTSRYGRRYGRRTYARRYSRFGSRKRFFSRYRTRRFY